MVDPALYRATMIPVVVAALILLFSVVSRPSPERSEETTDAFSGGRAAALATALEEAAPERVPGSEDADAATAFVIERFGEIEGGEVAEQDFTAPWDGDDAEMTNVSLLLPGETDERLLILAPRDCAEGTCSASSAAATGALLELARAVDSLQHRKTVLFVSTDGSVAESAGAKALADLLEVQPPQAAIAILRPASAEPSPPYVLTESAGSQSASVGLVESAEAAAGRELGEPAELPRDTLSSLLGLALPVGLGDQAVLIARDIDAVGFSSEGDLPLDPARDTADDVSSRTLGETGRAALSLFVALDAATGPLEHGPGSYVPLAGKLLPDWALSLLCLALILPVGIVSAEALLRDRRRGGDALRALAWAALWSLPFLGALLLAHGLELVGLLPGPAFPYVPGLNEPGAGGIISIVMLAGALGGGVFALSRWRRRPGAESSPAAVGLAAFAGVMVLWVINPFLALLAVPALHLWPVTAARSRGRVLGVAALAIGLLPALALALHVAGELDVGGLAPWHLLLFVSGHHLGFATMLCLCVLGGCLAAAVDGLLRPNEGRQVDAYAIQRG